MVYLDWNFLIIKLRNWGLNIFYLNEDRENK